jgi:hypothetical protein
MKPKPNLIKRMWLLFAYQIFFAFLITVSCLSGEAIMLHTMERTDRNDGLVPKIRQEVHNEQDPAKLRRVANALIDETASDAAFRIESLHFLIKISASFCFGFFVFSLGTGVVIYRFQQERRQNELSG